MIPETDSHLLDEGLDNRQQPSLTWKLDFNKGQIIGKTDGIDAVKQAVFKALQTNRFWHDVYSFDYGHELTLLIGSNPAFIESEAKRMIREALLPDDRIADVKDIEVSVIGERMMIRFAVATVYGSFEGEISQNV